MKYILDLREQIYVFKIHKRRFVQIILALFSKVYDHLERSVIKRFIYSSTVFHGN